MARPKRQTDGKPAWGIYIYYPDNTCGWIVGEGANVITYPTQEEAEKSLKQMKRNKKYSWSLPIEVKEFIELSNEKEI